MKHILFILLTGLFTANAFAQMSTVTMIDADMEVRYYENRMPEVVPDGQLPSGPRNHYRVEATVEFCRNVSADEFSLQIDTLNGMNIMSLHAEIGLIDCFGPTREQVLVYRMPEHVDTNLPFSQLNFVPVIFEGLVF